MWDIRTEYCPKEEQGKMTVPAESQKLLEDDGQILNHAIATESHEPCLESTKIIDPGPQEGEPLQSLVVLHRDSQGFPTPNHNN